MGSSCGRSQRQSEGRFPFHIVLFLCLKNFQVNIHCYEAVDIDAIVRVSFLPPVVDILSNYPAIKRIQIPCCSFPPRKRSIPCPQPHQENLRYEAWPTRCAI